LRADPYETTDVWSQYPAIVEELTLLLARYQNEGRSVPLR